MLESQAGIRSGGGQSTIVVSANSCWNVVNFRSGLIRALRNRGHRIVVAAQSDEYAGGIAALGAELVDLPMNSAGASVAEDLRLLIRYVKLFRQVRPQAYLGFTAKPNIYGSLAAGTVGAKVINNISGLGTVFIKRTALTGLVSRLYRFSLRHSSTVFFQNRDDMNLFIKEGLARSRQAQLLPGSGVDLQRFKQRPSGRSDDEFRFLLIGRLLWDKGIAEFVEAARIVRQSRPDARFQLLGPMGANNRTAVPSSFVDRYRSENIVEYLGESDDVRTAISHADCIVLPSYREGLPRSLLEGSAMGKPLIGTDVPGCRDIIVDGETGYLCAARSAESLAAAMLKMLEMSYVDRRDMGQRGRCKVEREYSETLVIAKYLDALGTR